MSDGGFFRFASVFLVVVVVVLAGAALLSLVSGGSGTPDGASIDGQSPASFQPENVNPDVDPEDGEISVDEGSEPKRLLVDTRHSNQFARSDLEPIIEATFRAGHTVEFPAQSGSSSRPSRGGGQDQTYNETLAKYDGVLIIQPTQGFTSAERTALREYTESGGRVVVLAEPTQTQAGTGFFAVPTTVSFGANNLTANYGVRMGSEMLYNIENDRNDNNFKSIYATATGDGTLTEGVETISFDLGGYAVVDDSSDASVLFSTVDGTRALDTRREGNYPTVVRNGNMVFVADSSFIKRSELYDVDNEVFVGNLMDFLVGGDLSDDFPEGTSAPTPTPPQPPEPPTPSGQSTPAPPGSPTPTPPGTPPSG